MVEKLLQQKIIKKFVTSGWLVYKMTSPSTRGIPDLVCMRDGETIWLEVKTPRGRLSAMQRAVIGRIRNQGIRVYVVNSIEQAGEIAGKPPRRSATGGDRSSL